MKLKANNLSDFRSLTYLYLLDLFAGKFKLLIKYYHANTRFRMFVLSEQ